ncbi:RIB43A-like with coiled-coils protein 2 [Microcaecilia unicolor]|uniref:RIB43A-like with coiled-coils protein 2 n=1 Tax=Microcaecilia unicolor TaxID=1415580 RepID=A0A6P7ZUQ0_9AMPH|nr:RIB43A-like with coiled-coils protein 2 [Microcaecilia unicolor]
MYKLDVPVDRKEAAVLERRRNAELQRQSRIFDCKIRTIGIDKDALDIQVNDRNIQKETEKRRHELYATQMVQNDKIACLLEDRQANDIRNLNKAMDEFRLCNQKPETRREFDLSDLEALKKSLPARLNDGDPRCTFSGLQKLLGEDLSQEQRKKSQQEQLREWSLQQQRDLAKTRADKKFADDLYNKNRIKLDERAMELQRMEKESRRAVCLATKDYNIAQVKELAEKKVLEKQQVEEDDKVEISNLLRGDFLSENPEQASSSFGPHRVITDRWKGMGEEELMKISDVQQQQVLEKMRLKEEEWQRDAQWNRERVQAARAMTLLERQQKRATREIRRAQDHANLELAEAQQARKLFDDNEVYSNAPSAQYFMQFNTTSR